MDIGQQIAYIKSHFLDLYFEEASHSYFVRGTRLHASVSKLLGDFYEPFNTEDISYSVSIRDNVPQEEIKKSWKEISDEACERGTRVHRFGELYPFNRDLVPSCGQERAVKRFWDELPPHIIPVMLECRMYHKEYMFAGTADILLYDTLTNTYIIGDYKTNKDLFKNYKRKTLLLPFENLLDSPFNKYQLQLSFYQILLEQTGVKVSSRKLIWLMHDGNYKMWDTEDLTAPLKRHLMLKYKICRN